LQRGVLGAWSTPLLADERLTVAEFLREQGYTTGMFGKWHLGFTWPTKNGAPPATGADQLSNVDFSQPIGGGPTAHGFDYYFGVDVPNYPPYCFIENDRTLGTPSVPAPGREQQFNRPGPMLPGWKLEDILPELAKRAARWIEQSAKSGKPFFAYVPLTSPHYPVVPSREYRGKTKAGDFGDFVHQTDACVGQILEALQRAGVATNTLVFFTSDNGPEITGEVDPGAYDRIRRYGHSSMGDWRGAKRDLWEGGHRVPFVARWPARIKPGSVSSETICHVDFLRTVAAILEKPLPDDAAEDSFNILPALLGRKDGPPLREATVHHSGSGKFAIRQGDWVLITTPTGDDNGTRGEPAWFRQDRGYVGHAYSGELYNLREDPSEKHNQFAARPEIVAGLKELLARYQREGRSTPGAPQSNDVPVIGGSGAPRTPAAPGKKSAPKRKAP
jgi:arylsulfatase A-like enzyme